MLTFIILEIVLEKNSNFWTNMMNFTAEYLEKTDNEKVCIFGCHMV